MSWACKSCKVEYTGFGLPNRCLACGKREWDTQKAAVLDGNEQNPLDTALEKLEAYDRDCEPRTLRDIAE